MRRMLLFEIAIAALLMVQFHEALRWLGRTFRDATYESWGLLALLLLAPALLRPPPLRDTPSTPHLVGVVAVALLDLALAPLRLHVLSALLAIVALHLCRVSLRRHAGRWWAQRPLWLALLSLPVVFWANVLFGHPVQQAVTRVAAAALGLYGLPATTSGTLIELRGATIAVDATCSGLKLLYSGLLFGLLAAPRRRRWLFWSALVGALFGANVLRVLSLAVAQLHLGRPVGDLAHEAVGLLAFALACGGCLLLARRPSPVSAAGVPG